MEFRIKTFQSNVFGTIPNYTLHQDSNIPIALEEIENRFNKFQANLSSLSNPLVQQLLSFSYPR
jgi:hypothetical protein